MIRKSVFSVSSLLLIVAVFITSCGGGGSGSGSGNSPAISAFSFTSTANLVLSTNVTGVISGTSITATVPYGTTVTALVATFTTTGTSVSVGSATQTSGVTSNDFTNSVTYTVSAADGSTQEYTVTVTIAVNSAKEITAFGFTSAKNSVLSTNVTGVISGTNISVTVPYGTTSVTDLVATFTTTGASVKIGTTVQTSGETPNDFSSAKTYTVTGADGSTQDYTVTVTVAAANAKEITAFSFPAVTWSSQLYGLNHSSIFKNDLGTAISGTSITVKLPYGSTSMAAAFATTGASVTVGGVPQVSGVTENDFTNPVTYRVTAADGTWQDYTVTVLFVPAVNSLQNTLYGGVLSSYWDTVAYTSTDADSMDLRLTCDAINAGSDTFTMQIICPYGYLSPRVPGWGTPCLTVPSDTTVTDGAGDPAFLTIVGPLNSIQSVIAQIEYIPPSVVSGGAWISIILWDKNGLMARGRIEVTVSAPGGG